MRPALVRTIRHLVLNPAALIGWLIGLVVVIALIVAIPFVAPSIPGLNTLRPQSAPNATEDYMRGNQNYDASLMWSSLSGDAQSRLRDQGGSPEDLQRQMDTAKQRGMKLEQVSYIGGKALPDGSSMQFYLVGIRQQPRSDLDYQPYMFTLDRDGKIAKVQ
jgi:hypothetical protein